MEERILSAAEAFASWPRVRATVLEGRDVLIEDAAGEPVVLIRYEDYDAIREALEDLRDSRSAEAAWQEHCQNPAGAHSLEEVEAELRANGVLRE